MKPVLFMSCVFLLHSKIWGLRGGIFIDADFGPLRYFCTFNDAAVCICHEVFNLIQICPGHTVVRLLDGGHRHYRGHRRQRGGGRHSVGGGRRQPQLPPPRLHVCWSSLLLIHQGNTKDPLAVVHRNYRTAPTFSASLAIPALLWSSSYIWNIGVKINLKLQLQILYHEILTLVFTVWSVNDTAGDLLETSRNLGEKRQNQFYFHS